MSQQAAFSGIIADQPCSDRHQTQGQRANMTGRRAESTIYCIVKELGYRVERQYPACIGIHGGQINVDFYIHPTDRFPRGLIIESKWQETPGSADEKFCFLVENIRSRYPAPTLIVYGGGGARPGMVEWMKRQADGQRIYAVLAFEEFITWVNRNL